MTVSNLTNRVQYSGNASTTIFSFGFKIFADTELVVTETVTATGVETTKSLSTHYTVQGAGNESGGTVTMGVAPASATTLTIKRELALTQTTDFLANDAFSSESLESALDRLIMVSQQLDELDDRSINFPISDAVGLSTILPTAIARANKVLSFDASGNVITSQEIGTLKGNWAASTIYIVRDLVKDTATNNIFMCIVAHTSSGSQPLTSNTDAAKWSLIVDAASATTSVTAAATSATASAASAVTSANEATASAASAVTSGNSATASATSATAAAASSTAATTAQSGAEASAGALAFKYTFDNSTVMGDPGVGEVRFNHATLANITQISIDATSADTGNPDISDLIASIDDGSNSAHEGYMFVRKQGAAATFVAFDVTSAVTDSGGHLTHSVVTQASSGTISNGDTLYISWVRSGNVGATGSTGPTGPTGPAGPVGIGLVLALGG
jgi:hypothetical protein